MKHNYQDLIIVFNQLFEHSYNTILDIGGDEPVYLPADLQYSKHRILFANKFFSSALHEISHWCIAGKKRRLLADYGYWYQPDGRDEKEQIEFETVEVKPQAIEWILSVSCNFPFQVSCDNLYGNVEPDRAGFKEKVRQQALLYLQGGMPKRAKLLSDTLCLTYGRHYVTKQDFVRDIYLK